MLQQDKTVPEVDEVLRQGKNLERFKNLFTYIESNGISLDSSEARTIARHATTELGITPVDKFDDLKLESLSNYAVTRIIARSRSAVKQLLALKTKYAPIIKKNKKEDGTEEETTVGIAGPYVTNRRLRRSQNKRHVSATTRAMTASDLVNRLKQRNG